MAGRARDPSGYSLGKEQTLKVMRRVEQRLKERPADEQTWSWLSRRTGIIQGHLSNFKSGKRLLQRRQVVMIAEALGAQENDLVAGVAPVQSSSSEIQIANTPGEQVGTGILPTGLQEFLDEFGDKVTPEERRLLETSHFQHPSGARMDRDFWFAVWRAWRHALDPVGGSGGSPS